MKKTRVLIVGDDRYDMYAKAFYQGFIEEGYECATLFATNRCVEAKGQIGKLLARVQEKFAVGPMINKINRELLREVKKIRPELVFLYSARLVRANTVRKLKEQGIIVFLYNNDDPFADYFPKYFWRHYLKSLSYADKIYVYRQKNITDCIECGYGNVELLRSYYIKDRNFYSDGVNLNVPRVLFLGHHEDDEREEYIKAALDAEIEVGIMRKSWELFEENNPYLVKLDDTHKLYNQMLNAADIAIVFLSKINNDTYTRRCFEIPAVKTMMLSVYTEDIASMFEDGEEVVFFNSKEEFVEKIQYYLKNSEKREAIANAGYRRVMRDGHEVCNRVRQIMEDYYGLKE